MSRTSTIDSPSRVAVSLLAACLLLPACGPRPVEIIFHTPTYCGSEGGQPLERGDCPLAGVQRIETELIRVDGTSTEQDFECVETPDLCDFEDLEMVRLFTRGTPSDGVEIRLTGRGDPECPERRRDAEGPVVLNCESFGDSVVELPEVDTVDVWCDCPPGTEVRR